MLRAALGHTPAASHATHGAGCASQWLNVIILAGHLKRSLARRSSTAARRSGHHFATSARLPASSGDARQSCMSRPPCARICAQRHPTSCNHLREIGWPWPATLREIGGVRPILNSTFFFCFSDLKFEMLDTIWQYCIDQIRNLGSDTTDGEPRRIRITPSDEAAEEQKFGNYLESPNEGSSIDHQVTIYLHAQNITMFPTNETWYFASQILVSISGGLILILTAQSTRN
ncbi:hypothetical protein F511_44679 [Dorcoceras hygrometricum]|uniref:Uncharacterized protein n=1 Tax=Dorcoceras hygrometricum TaxID=472368 RepID=A0A2Z7D4R7_9LAMI|nr:hypothetical protein F511_44679 [Dorcoceras hygrometricum]